MMGAWRLAHAWRRWSHRRRKRRAKQQSAPKPAHPIRLRIKRLGRRLGVFQKPVQGARIPPTSENVASGYWGRCVTTRRHKELIARFVADDIPKSSRILDVGCSKGFLAMGLAQHGWEALSGCDHLLPDDTPPEQKNYVDFRHVMDYRRADLDQDGLAAFAPDQFDVIVCSEVMEHLESPSFMLKEFQRVLKPGGRVYIEVPNTGNIFERWNFLRRWELSRYRSSHRRDHRTHISILTPDVVRLLAVRSDFDLITVYGGYAMFWNEFLLHGRPFSPWFSYGVNYVLKSNRTVPWTEYVPNEIGRNANPAPTSGDAV